MHTIEVILQGDEPNDMHVEPLSTRLRRYLPGIQPGSQFLRNVETFHMAKLDNPWNIREAIWNVSETFYYPHDEMDLAVDVVGVKIDGRTAYLVQESAFPEVFVRVGQAYDFLPPLGDRPSVVQIEGRAARGSRCYLETLVWYEGTYWTVA